MRAILFDFGGTLDSPRHWLDRFLSHYRSAGVDISRDELDVAYDSATRAAYRAEAALREYGLGKLVRYLVDLQLAALGASASPAVRRCLQTESPHNTPVRLAERISDGFVAESRRGLAHSREILSRLAMRFELGVVSNFYGNLDQVLKEAKIADLLSVTVDSSRLGIFKPDRRIFETALQQFGVQPDQIAVVGDSLEKDCAPARSLGMRTVWLRHVEFAGEEPKDKLFDYTVNNLSEVEEIQWSPA